MAKIDAWIHYIDNISNVFSITYQYFEMTPGSIVWIQSK